MNAPEGATPCETAYAAIDAEQQAAKLRGTKSIFEWVAPKPDFLTNCQALTPGQQKCMVPHYRRAHDEECQRERPSPDTLAKLILGVPVPEPTVEHPASCASDEREHRPSREDEVEQRRHLEHRDDAEEERLQTTSATSARAADEQQERRAELDDERAAREQVRDDRAVEDGQGGDPVAHQETRAGSRARRPSRWCPASRRAPSRCRRRRRRAGSGTGSARRAAAFWRSPPDRPQRRIAHAGISASVRRWMLLKLANAKQPANVTAAAWRVRKPAIPATQPASVTHAIARSTPGGIRQR